MRKLILTITSLLILAGVNGQKKEINDAVTAVEANDINTAKSLISNLSGTMDSNTIDPELKAKYFYTAGQIALKEGDTSQAAESFSELAKYQNQPIFYAKNKDTKETEYFTTREEAGAATASGNYNKVKEKDMDGELLGKVLPKLEGMAQQNLNAANTALEGKKFDAAGDKLMEVSNLAVPLGLDSDMYKYNAALTYHQGKDYQKAFDIYKALLDKGYTGETSTWVGTNTETGEKQAFNSQQDAQIMQKAGQVKDLKLEKTESIERDLGLWSLNALANLNKYDSIVETITKKFPKDEEIQRIAANVYLNSGNQDEFLNKLLENEKINPNDGQNLYNIGIVYKEQGKNQKAIDYFKKAIKAAPDNANAYSNLVVVKLNPDKEFVETINNNLGSDASQTKVRKEYMQKRKSLYLEVIPYLEKAFEIDGSYENAKILRQAYSIAEEFDKEDAMHKIENGLKEKLRAN